MWLTPPWLRVRQASIAGGCGAVIEAGASVRDAVVSAGARIAAGATVDRSIVGPGAVVGADAHLRNLSMVGDSAVVDPGAELDGGRIPEETS